MASNCIAVVCGAIDVAIFLSVAAVSISMRQFLAPVHRGFFSNDQSLMHPYRSSTITSEIVYLVGFGVPLVVILITEFLYVKYKWDLRTYSVSKYSDTVKWLIHSFRVLAFLIFGGGCTHFLTNIGKYSIGRLRPHFFDVCKPDWSRVGNSSQYVEENICTGKEFELMKEARLSFPSGHASMSMYCAVFFILYIEYRLTWNRMLLLRPFIQTVAFSAAFYTSLSRIYDFKHHWSDVLAGAILGIVIASLVMWKYLEFQAIRAYLKLWGQPDSFSHMYVRYPASTADTSFDLDFSHQSQIWHPPRRLTSAPTFSIPTPQHMTGQSTRTTSAMSETPLSASATK